VLVQYYWDSWRAETPTPGAVSQRPTVESVIVNGGEADRSQVTQIAVAFVLPGKREKVPRPEHIVRAPDDLIDQFLAAVDGDPDES